jgi:type II secretory pathway pseudopilin PulG
MIKVNKSINTKHKKAFSMITAIFVIIIMATVTSLIMNVTGKTVKETTQQYQKEQAQLLARSYTELAILNVLHYDRSADCLENITDHFGATGDNGYDINITIKYIGQSATLTNCLVANKIATLNGSTKFDNTVSMVIDTYIKYRDFDDPQKRDITFHRRTLQKL